MAILDLPYPAGPERAMIAPEAGRPFDSAQSACCPLPSGRMSLLDMINFVLSNFVAALAILSQEIRVATEHASATPDALIRQEDSDRLNANFRYVFRTCVEMQLGNACNRAERTNRALQRNPQLTYFDMMNELNVLREAIEDDIRFERFFHYRQDKVGALINTRGEWAMTLTKFPSADPEIEEGLDCYGLEHNTASVFHMMRVAEIGMRALARERQVTFPKHPLEWADWQNILEQTESRAKAATNGMGRGPAKDAAAAFYSGATGQLHAFKDTYRNVTMHVRRRYDELDALRAINQVCDFMNGLSKKIGEKTRRPIRRWP